MTFAEDLTERYPASAKTFVEMAAEEEGTVTGYSSSISSALGPGATRDVPASSKAVF
jgi:hypothetical protein